MLFRSNAHLVVSLLFLDLDLYEPTRVALQQLVPRMPKGAVLAFDELDNPIWPGETLALLDTVGMRHLRVRRFPWDPYVGYAVIELPHTSTIPAPARRRTARWRATSGWNP